MILFLFACVLLFPTYNEAQNPIWDDCFNSPNYTSGSQFETNLNLLLPSLITNASRNDGFFTATVGDNPPNNNNVYGLIQCRGDISTDDCRNCMNNASTEITKRCPNRKEALIMFDQCLLRYSNGSFFTKAETSPQLYLSNPNNVSDPDVFNRQLENLMDNLSNTAIRTTTKFQTGSINYINFEYIYGLVQCTRDLSETDCFSCLRDMVKAISSCCAGLTQGRQVLSPSCYLRYELNLFYNLLPPPSSVPAVSPPPPINGGSKGNSSSNVVVIVVPTTIATVVLAIILGFFIRRKISRKAVTRQIVEDEIESAKSLQFDLGRIRVATNNFSDANKLGQGGFGAVYKGKLSDGQEIAVKRLSKTSGQGSQEFKNEVMLVAKLQHRNLVRLLGFCLEGEEKILVYEYVTNTSLDKYLFDPIKRTQLNWERRYKIIEGIARGLLYLHEDSRLRIIHRDLKAGNILLDENMNPKIADFGMAKLFGVDQTRGNTSRIAGTFGYMAPEYLIHGQFSVKSDVFSFGVLLLEIVSGQRSRDFNQTDGAQDILSYAWKHWGEGTALEMMDQTLTNSYSREEVMRSIHIGLLCVQENVEDRPTMSSVVLMLNRYSLTLTSPSPPAFFAGSTRMGSSRYTNTSDQLDSNEVSLLKIV